MYDECKYLFLSKNQAVEDNGVIVWNNLPTISESRRQCYITVANMVVVFGSVQPNNLIMVQMNLPTGNYYSSNNDEPIVSFLESADLAEYGLPFEQSIKILSTDQLKKIELKLLKPDYTAIDLAEVASINVMLKLEYIDTQKQVMSYLSTKPSTL